MGRGIPGSAIKFYTEKSGGVEVTGGSSDGATIYPRLSTPFIENLTGKNKLVNLPYYGRVSLHGFKVFKDSLNVTGAVATSTLPGFKNYSDYIGDQPLEIIWTGQGDIRIWRPIVGQDMGIPKGAGRLTLKWKDNLQKYSGGIEISLPTACTFVSFKIAGVSIDKYIDDYTIPNDIGRVGLYEMELIVDIAENTSLARELGAVYFNGAVCYMTQDGLPLDVNVTPNNVFVNNSTGVCPPVTVTATGNWFVL